MTNYRAILEYHYKGNTTTQVARICECSRTTVLKTIKRAKECGLTQFSVAGMNDFKLLCKLYPNRVQRAEYTYPDFEANYMPISWVIGDVTTSDNATDYRHRDKIIEICDEYRKRIDRLYMELRVSDDQEKEVVYEKIEEEKADRDKQVSKWLTSRNVLIFVARHYEKNRPSDWRIYAPIVNARHFKDFMLKGGSPIGFVEESRDGNTIVYGKKFAIKW